MAIDITVLDGTAPKLTAEWKHFAEMVFPDASADQLKTIETAFFSGMHALQRLQDGLAEACASGLSDDLAMAYMKSWKDELEAFGKRRGAELALADEGTRSPPPASSAPTMSDEEKIAAFDVYNRLIREAFAPLIAGRGKPGMVAVRAFFTLRQKDGTISGSHTGLTADPAEGEYLKSQIAGMLVGEPDYSELHAIEQPRKS